MSRAVRHDTGGMGGTTTFPATFLRRLVTNCKQHAVRHCAREQAHFFVYVLRHQDLGMHATQKDFSGAMFAFAELGSSAAVRPPTQTPNLRGNRLSQSILVVVRLGIQSGRLGMFRPKGRQSTPLLLDTVRE